MLKRNIILTNLDYKHQSPGLMHCLVSDINFGRDIIVFKHVVFEQDSCQLPSSGVNTGGVYSGSKAASDYSKSITWMHSK